jgi:hypothetical protein
MPSTCVAGYVQGVIYARTVTQDKKDRSTGALIIVGMLIGGLALWQKADTEGWISHDTIALVTAKDWSIGEYRYCQELNDATTKDEPRLDCSNNDPTREPKRFQVSFYGDTYEADGTTRGFVWRCKKEEGTEPSFTCNDRKPVTADSPH